MANGGIHLNARGDDGHISGPPVWLGCLLILAMLILARPYSGLRHDGVLYVGQALSRIWPQVFAHDIFFSHGSQDDFSIVSRVLSTLYMRVGLDVVHLVVPFFSQVALLLASWKLLQGLRLMERWLGLALIATGSHIYGGYAIFAFGERYLTGRTFAEPIALFALALILTGRRGMGFASLLVAGAFHPLVALPVAAVVWVFLTIEDRRWGWAASLLALPFVAAAAGIKPFGALLETLDADWLAPLGTASPHLFVSSWRVGDWQIALFDAGVLLAGARLLPQPSSRLAMAVLVSVVGLLALSLVLVDGSSNVLLTQLQLWRVLWIAHLLGLALVPALAWRWWGLAGIGRMVAAAFVLAAVAVNAGWATGLLLIAWWAIALLLLHRQIHVSPALVNIGTVGSALAAVVLSAASAGKLVRLSAPEAGGPSIGQVMLLAAAITPLLSVGIAVAVLNIGFRNRWRLVAAGLLSAVLFAVGVMNWDHRTEWSKYVEGSLDRTHPFANSIPSNGQVYWHKDLAATWAVLHRASYFSSAQAAGIVFNRATAIELARRQKAFAKLGLQESICAVVNSLQSSSDSDEKDCVPTMEVVSEICRSEPQLGYLVFKFPLDGAVIDQWTFQPKIGAPTTYYLHDCLHLR
jgi:hypothetical protein